ncbi:membrane protein insertion efficiency factor YidD [Patescibacteria group bacterium]|nr:membrane protein insertion efficiency factor YidD [Patescibacteria group bacterium]MBU1868618.1 membrane protein insertion efficiency factor YidD [Patescibacteria group bacterium]
MKKVVLLLIRIYQKAFSQSTHWLVRNLGFSEVGCRFEPCCSVYTYRAIDKYGLIKGGLLGLRRVIRCHPWSKGGYDPLK